MSISQPPQSPPSTLVELLAGRAAERPDGLAYTFLDDVGGGSSTYTYGQLDGRARAIGQELAARARPGARALLLYPAGLDFIAAFFGALYGGVVAVPAYPPDPARLARSLPRLQAVLEDAQVELVLTTRAILALAKGLWPAMPRLAALHWLATDALDEDAPGFAPAPAAAAALVMLQYTSGSTGTPKGVMLSHGNLLANQAMIFEGFEHDASTVVAGWLPQYHDMGLIGNILHPLYGGVPAVLMSPQAFLARPVRWLEMIAQHRATTSGGPNFAYELCVRKSTDEDCRRLDLSSWRLAFTGAEPVRADTLRRFRARFGPAGFEPRALYPCYGLAEATLIVTGHRRGAPLEIREVDAGALGRDEIRPATAGAAALSLVASGRALGGSRVAIVDPATRRRCAAGQVGEVWVAGPHVALGYWGNPEATRETFEARVEDDGDGPYLRTGDLGFLAGDQLVLVGRLKDLIILRGRNHHPEDLEWTIEGVHPALRPGCSAAFAVQGEAGEELVIVAELARGAAAAAEGAAAAVREAVAAQHEVQPDRVYLVESGALPKTSSGKIQRRAARSLLLSDALPIVARWAAAPAPGGGRPAGAGAPTSLLQLVADRLGVAEQALDLDAPLTRYGVDSLSATELLWDAQQRLGVALSIGELLGGASLRELAGRPAAASGNAAAGASEAAAAAAASDVREGELSAGEEALWFLHHLAPESAAYHVATALRVRSPLDLDALRAALDRLVARHPALRTRYPAHGGKPVAAPCAEPLDFAALDADTLAEEAHRPFDLARGPLLRVRALVRPGEPPVVLLVLHHIITDFWSLCVLADELAQLYREATGGAVAALPPPPPPYRAHVAARRAFLDGADGARSLAYWRAALTPEVPPLELPTDRPRPPAQRFRGAAEPLALDAGLCAQLEALARRQGATLYAVLLAAYQVLLARYTGQADFAVGVPTAGREPQLHATAGYFVNVLPLRADLAGRPTFEQLARRVQGRLAELLEHQAYPLPRLIEQLSPARDPARSPIFQTVFVLQQANRLADAGLAALALGEGGHRAALGPLEVESVALAQRTSQFDLTLHLARIEGGLAGACEYDTDLFDRDRVARLLGHYQELLRWLVAHPGAPVAEAELLPAAERRLLLEAWVAPGPAFAPIALHRLVEQQVQRAPDAPAVERGERRLTYGELDARANQLARRLRRLGVGPEARVGICMRRAPEMIVAMLGVLKAGGAYVPLDPEHPPARLAWMQEDAAITVLLTDRDWPDVAEESVEPLPDAPHPDQLAYVIYTSGSTGRPKAVMTTHGAISNYLQATQREHPLGPADRVLQLSALSFDASVAEIFTALIAGAQVVLAAPDEQREPARVVARLRDDRITVVQLVPSLLQFLVQEPGFAALTALRLICCGGEAMPAELIPAVLARPGVTLLNCYGPAEATIDAARLICGRTVERGVVAVGRAVPNLRVHVLDEELRPVPVGVPGEAYIGGAGLARGYLGRPGLTAERFVPDPFTPGARLYRAGDRLRYRPAGDLEFLGRRDHQVKLRGQRVELGEIEAQLAAHDGVEAAAVTVHEAAPGQRQLVAHVVPAHGRACDERELRAWLAARLPDAMVPSVFLVSDALPRSPSGKVERHLLPAPAPAAASRFAPPRTPTEEIVASVFARVLGHPAVGAGGDFFELGGHSLLAAQLAARLREIFQIDLPLQALFTERTVENLARVIADGRAQGGGHLRPVERIPGDVHPQSPAQQRLWFLDQLEPGSALYLIPAALRFAGELSIPALARTLQLLVDRHPSLRTSFAAAAGQPVQRVAEAVALELPVVDLQHLGGAAQRAEVERRARADAATPLALGNSPLLRVTLLRLGPAEHVLLLTVHHIVADGRSLELLLRDLEAIYPAVAAGRPVPAPAPAVTYADYTAWQAALLREVEAAQLAYWRQQLAGIPERMALPTDHPPPAVRSPRGAIVRFPLPAPAALQALAAAESASLFMALLAGFQILLHQITGEPDLVVGTPVANRPRRELEDIVGLFVNTLVLRARVDGRATPRALLRQLRDTALAAYAHQDLPFERLVEALNPRRSLGETPLVRVMFALEDAAGDRVRIPDIVVEPLQLDRDVVHLDLILTVTRADGALEAALEYSAELFARARIERMAAHLVAIYEAMARDPDAPIARAGALPPAQAARLLALGQGAPVPAFAPRGGAADGAGWPARLRAAGVGAGARIGVLVEPALDRRALALAIWSAGGAIVPLDPDQPRLRLARMMDDAGLSAVIASAALQGRLPAEPRPWPCLLVEEGGAGAPPASAVAPAAPPAPDDLAAVLFCPGEARPAPLAVTHGALAAWAAGAGADEAALGAAQGALAGSVIDVAAQAAQAPWPGLRRYVVDADGALAPEGTVGELWLGGAMLGAGHPGLPSRTAARWLPDPFAAEPGARLYRTGALARWDADGALHLVGRRDRRIELGGAWIDLGEIEAALVEHPRVARAAAVASLDARGQRRAWAHVMLAPGAALTVEALAAHLRRRLPAAAIPAGFTFFAHGPRDLSQLGPPAATALERPDRVPPRTEAESRLAALWQELLGVAAIGVHDDFFELGGHSLLATQLVSRIRSQWGIALPIRAVFETPTIAGIAATLDARPQGLIDPIAPAGLAADDLLARIDELSGDDLDRALAEAEARAAEQEQNPEGASS